MKRIRSLVAMVAFVLVACGSSDGQGGSSADPAGAATGSPVTADSTLAVVERAAIEDLARRLKVEPDAIEVVQSKAVTWPDTSRGCPQPGMTYAAVQDAGFQVILRHDGRVYPYPAGSDGIPSLCASAEDDGGYDFVPPPGFDE
jgi:hypothetical protein